MGYVVSSNCLQGQCIRMLVCALVTDFAEVFVKLVNLFVGNLTRMTILLIAGYFISSEGGKCMKVTLLCWDSRMNECKLSTTH